ncbi:hypothetical protein TIFTF001_005758 [Ficus carica]|uniref:Uncharacterized protein n=1 Tax=Ficus carica TaxID=3494 RepID=A0AA87ZLE4_FICCA|nr:hypothetical protein TIFTF001_005758 [Ficus carica]
MMMKMGSSFKKAIFEEHIQEGLVGWARQAKKNKGVKRALNGSIQVDPNKEASVGVQMASVAMEEGQVGEIQHAPASDPDGLK